MLRKLLCLLLITVTAGCSQTIKPPPPPEFTDASLCQPALTELQQLANRFSGNQSSEAISTSPWLRSNRLVDYYVHHYPLEESQLQDLLLYMADLSASGLKLESRLLPPAEFQRWQERYQIEAPESFISDCTKTLAGLQAKTPTATLNWLRQLPEDNDYQPLARVFGLYPLTALLFKQGVIREQKQLQEQPEQLKNSAWFHYVPLQEKTRKIPPPLKNLSRNSIGIPLLSPSTEQALLEYHAPVWRLPDNETANRPGHPYWQQETLQVDQQPVNFSYISHGIYRQKPTLQLNYLIWFPERPAESKLDLVAGKHDAVLFRVHLAQSGIILAYDSIHLCGCWYTLMLPHAQSYLPDNRLYSEPTFVIRTAPGRQRLTLTADSHLLIETQRLENLSLQHRTDYVLKPFTQLLQLPSSDAYRSVFNKQGVISGSERAERWLFWPMGIANAGALRRPGDHAIRFIGNLHFDDPLILEKLGVGR